MESLHIQSVKDPFTNPDVAGPASTLLGRAETMGFLHDLGTISTLDNHLIATVLQRLGQTGLLQRTIMLGTITQMPGDPAGMVNLLEEANTALEHSPLPLQEWTALRPILGDALLARLCGITEASFRRYAAGTRSTPDAVAQRLHSLALLAADLRGAYNDYGIRRWFQRPRAQLGGRTPVEVLPAGWTPESPEMRQLQDLAGALRGSPAT